MPKFKYFDDDLGSLFNKTPFDELKNIIPYPNSFDCISMGMSGDYKIAIKKGSNMIRIGSTIFGSR